MKTWTLWAGALVIFCCGAAVGIIGSRLYVKSQFNSYLAGDRGTMASIVMKRLHRGLDLSEAEMHAITPIVEETAKDLILLRKRNAPELEAMWDRAEERIKAALPPEKKQRATELFDKLQRRREAFYKKNTP